MTKFKIAKFFILIIFSILLASCDTTIQKADLILTNTNIWTGDESTPEAQAMAIHGDSIIAIGSNKEVLKFKDNHTQIVNAKEKFVYPGFIDSHVHLLMGGNALLSVELRDANTKEEFVRRIQAYAKTLEPGQWILEGNWDHTLWGGELPKKEWIDSFTENNPVALYRLDGHMILANTAALKLAGINKNTTHIEGGEIKRNANGEPTGVLKDNAMFPVLNKIPLMTEAQKKKAIQAASTYLLSNGVTTVHDVDSLGTFKTAYNMLKQGELTIRIYAANQLKKWKELNAKPNQNSVWLSSGLLKGFVDGSLGSHTASFKEPYTDKPDDSGFFLQPEEELYQLISEADKAKHQITIHAIGDNAINKQLNIYDRVSNENGDYDRRFRIEHVQHISPDDVKRLAALNVIASMQPYHAIDDGRWAEELIGPERIKTTYAFKTLLDANTKLVFGSDWPVAPASPLLGIYAASTRRTIDGKNPDGWVPDQKISVSQALKAYTTNAAYGSFDENHKGSLAVGKLADFVILNENILEIDPVSIPDVQVLETYVGGKKMFEFGN